MWAWTQQNYKIFATNQRLWSAANASNQRLRSAVKQNAELNRIELLPISFTELHRMLSKKRNHKMRGTETRKPTNAPATTAASNGPARMIHSWTRTMPVASKADPPCVSCSQGLRHDMTGRAKPHTQWIMPNCTARRTITTVAKTTFCSLDRTTWLHGYFCTIRKRPLARQLAPFQKWPRLASCGWNMFCWWKKSL